MERTPMPQSNFAALIDDRPEENLFRVHRRIYRDDGAFTAEMERIAQCISSEPSTGTGEVLKPILVPD